MRNLGRGVATVACAALITATAGCGSSGGTAASSASSPSNSAVSSSETPVSATSSSPSSSISSSSGTSSSESSPAASGSDSSSVVSPSPGSSSAASESAGGKKLTSAQFVNPLPNYPAWRVIGDCMAAEAKARGVDLTESGPSGSALDATVMIQQIQQAIANKKQAIITFPASEGFTPVLQQAQKAGIITATMYGAGGAAGGADTNTGVNWTALGKLYVDAIAKRSGQQNVGLVAAADTGVGKQWMDGVKSAAAATSNVKVVGEVYTNDDAAKALTQVNALLTAHSEVNVIATHMGTVTPGAAAAIKSKNLIGKVTFVGNGHDNGGTEAIKNGIASYILLQGLCQEGKDTLDAVLDVASGTPRPQVDIKAVMASKDDLQAYLDKQFG
jgi:ABC-type sugar transport system substrate-binding protein